MKLLSNTDQIWITQPSREDLLTGARYAALTLPWTFNRMMLNTGSVGQQIRGINIAKGIVGQEMLKRILEQRNVSPGIQRKSHRDDDLFDFRIPISGKVVNLDFKTFHVFTNYPGVNRETLSAKLIIENSKYGGPDWRKFFPMLVPHTQIGQDKDTYCFAIATSIDPRSDYITNRDAFALTAFPYGEHLGFFGSKKLCLSREAVNKGFMLSCIYNSHDILFQNEKISLTILGEWAGKVREESIILKHNKTIKNIGPFSCVCSFQMDIKDYQKFNGKISISVSKNLFDDIIYNSLRRDINSVPTKDFFLNSKDFCNLILPSDYKLYILGWTMKTEFLRNCRQYSGWVWPLDKVSKFRNQAWSQITESDKKLLSRLGFESYTQKNPSRINTGMMKTHGKGGGACCYVFPNIGRNGGIKETNLYVLPKDLYAMDELCNNKMIS